MVPTMTKARKDAADRRFVLWCCIDLRPEQLRFDQGFKLFLGSLSPEYVTTTMAKSTFNQTLDELYGTVLSSVVGELRTLREENLGMGYSGPFLGAQLDLTTAAGEEYITFTVTFVKKGDTDMTRIALAARAFPGSHTAEDIQPWIEKLTLEYFSGFMGESVQPSDVFLAFTVDQGKNIINACTALGVTVVECNCHRLNTAVVWALGIAGKGRLNPAMGTLMKKLAAMVGVFSHSAVNNDELKELQRLEEGFSRIYELLRPNDTRWTSQFKMMDRVLALKKPISEYFKKYPQNERKLTPNEWTITNEVCSLLSDVSEVTIRMQGSVDTHVGQAMFILHELIEMLGEDTHPIRQPNATVMPLPPEGIPTDDTQVMDLTAEAQCVLEVLQEKMREKGVGSAQVAVERLSALMDPRLRSLDSDQLENGSADLRKKAEDDLKAVIAKFDVGPATAAPAPAPVMNLDRVEPAPKKKKLSRLEERRAARVAAATTGGDETGSLEDQSPSTTRRVLIEREVLVYLAENPQLDVDGFNVLGYWNRRGTDSVSATTGKVTSPAEMPYLAFIARLYLGIEATSCQAERNFSALAHLIGQLRCNMLPSKVERMMFIRLNRHLVAEVRELDAAVVKAKAAKTKVAQSSMAAQEERANQTVDLCL
ncbi:unnamed protein product [Ectocarpus sp. CCAP 1310/34]|nr:unnamed protein product [Ectocarpus sp. CCAP 1310/34]